MSSGSILGRPADVGPVTCGTRSYVGNVFALTIRRRIGAVDCDTDVAGLKGERLLFGRAELDHVLVVDIASSENTSSLVKLALRRASKGFSSLAYTSLLGGL